jgi:integrase
MPIIEAAEGTTTYLPFAILAMTGLRRGEVLALRWTDVDLDAGELHVRRALSIVNGEPVFAEPKTERAQRAVPVTTTLGRILRSARAEQDARRLRLGQDWRDLGLVVTIYDGSPMRPEVVTHAFERLTKRLGVDLRLHDLRHAYASELLSRGVSILAVSRILGHASVAFTGDRYGHMMARDFDAVRAALSVEGAR